MYGEHSLPRAHAEGEIAQRCTRCEGGRCPPYVLLVAASTKLIPDQLDGFVFGLR